MLSEISPNGEEYFRFFRQECRRRGISIAAVETVSQSPEHLADNLDNLRQVNADALAYMGYGMLAAKGLLREALDELAWDPPRIMGTAFMFYLMGYEKFEGWVGIDQLDPSNPLVDGFIERYSRATTPIPMMWPNAIPVLGYDTARVLTEGLSGRRSCRARDSRTAWNESGSCPAAPAACTPTSRARRTSTACSAATGCSTAASPNGKLEFEGLFEPWE